MNIDVYKSPMISGSYIAVPSGVSPAQLPEPIQHSYGQLEPYKTQITISPGIKLHDVDPEILMHQIDSSGFYVAIEKSNGDVSKAGAAIGGGILLASIGFGPFGAIIGALSGLALASSQEKKIFDQIKE